MSAKGPVFLSYRSTQEDLALRLARDLQSAGLEVWIDKSKIKGSDPWRQSIENGIAQCPVMIAILSPEYLESDYCRKELSRADSLKRSIVPVLLKTIPPEDWPIEIQGAQYIDFRPWHKARRNKEQIYQDKFKELTQALENKGLTLQAHPPTPPSRQPWFKELWVRITGLAVLTAAIVAFLANITTIYQGVKDFFGSSESDKPNPVAQVTATSTSTPASGFDFVREPIPPDVLANEMSREALRVRVDGFADTPRTMVIAPSAEGRMALWGYDVNGTLFALDTATGSPLNIWSPADNQGDPRAYPLRPQISKTFRPSALHYDGYWLWIADSIGQQVIALDPATLELKAIWAFNGEPVAITSVENTLWVALYDTGELAAASFDRETGERASFCERERLKIGEAPSALVVDGRSAVWVAYGHGEEGAIRSVSMQGCQILEPIALEVQPKQLTLRENIMWVVSDEGSLFESNLSGNRTPQLVGLPNIWVEMVMDDGTFLWIADSKGPSLIVYDTGSKTSHVTLPLEVSPQALARFGAQKWLATNDDTVTQFILPDYIHPGLVDVVGVADALWLIDKNGNLCRLADLREECLHLSLDGSPITLNNASSADGNALWLATSTGAIWLVDLMQLTATLTYTLEWPALTLAEETGKYLWAANADTGMLTVIDLTTGEQHNALGFGGAPPDVIVYDGTMVWFAYGGARRQLAPIRYDLVSASVMEAGNPIHLMLPVVDILVDEGSAYVASLGILTMVNPLDGTTLHTIGIEQGPLVLAEDMEKTWGANRSNGFIYAFLYER
ncbi:MAG: toll/interleukin-1 receptor domain-containing protein [Anaerolineales bacterium]|nr:toll/interleukin-1 receptor domain-containing protein [Anaerolineales bacterium]